MTCEGHSAHDFETSDECRVCSHDRSEHAPIDGFWEDDRGVAANLRRASRANDREKTGSWTEAELREGFGR